MGNYYVIGGRGGKSLALAREAVRRSLEQGLPVAVTSELTKDRIIREAARQGVTIPEPVVVKAGGSTGRGITFAGVIVDKTF